MPDPEENLSVEALRTAAMRHVQIRGLRLVAREIGLSPGGLKKFVEGSKPYTRILFRLRAWHNSDADERLGWELEALSKQASDRIPHDVLRAALRGAVESSSLQTVAEQVGLTHRSVHVFINGESRPREATARTVREWYVREASARPGAGVPTIRAAIEVLLGGLPAGERTRAEAELRGTVRRACTRAKITPPGWTAAQADGAPLRRRGRV
jgi:hypothetical protein